ncbi:Apc15p protein-domain-containing protein [Diplogelasinospora grovesii]|uniref:Apc15p protein-domain-containing protein n=1 Tax=Diplogelasinospora grovesii TaxID=303347 RepID=A0AAN6SAS6_9PEZI|nr:Apc15p protein-domain-containing protein [Diplogelasinospora grovesii]
MFSSAFYPELVLRESHLHALLFTSSSHNGAGPPLPFDPSDSPADNANGHVGANGGNNPNARSRFAQAATIERSYLGRLRAEEQALERRRQNISNLGATWLKPPGVSKTLFQMREEQREAEEHAEALRRERLAQELAEAEAGGAAGDEDAGAPLDMEGNDIEGNDPMMGEDEEDGGRDLDEDIPDADAEGFGFDDDDDADDDDDDDNDEDDEDEEDEEDEEAEDSEDGETRGGDGSPGRQQRQVQQREFANIRATEDRMRQMIARGGQAEAALRGTDDLYGVDEEEIDQEDQAHILEEEDLLNTSIQERHQVEPGMDMDMDANLDDDIPEAESGLYEHTDSEAELSSDDDGGHQDVGFPPAARSSAVRVSQVSRYRSSLPGRSDGPRASMDISTILSTGGSSVLGSSPQIRRRA